MPEAILVDTDVASYLLKGDTRAELYRPHLSGRTVVLSFMSVAELYRWAEARKWGERRRKALEQHLHNFVTYGYNRRLCRVWATVMTEAQRTGSPLAAGDGWVAATALMHDIPLLTHNGRHYAGVSGLQVICENSYARGEGG